MIKGKKFSAAVLCAVMLSDCGSKSADVTNKFSENLEYTLGEYSVSEPNKLDDSTEWYISYTDKNGFKQSTQFVSHSPSEYLTEDNAENRKLLQTSDMFDFYSLAMTEIAITEMWDNIVSEHLDIEYEGKLHDMEISNDECKAVVIIRPVISAFKSIEYSEKMIDPENGIKLSEEDLSSIVSRDYVETTFSLRLEDGVDPEPYIQAIEAINAEFDKYDPQNYSFYLRSMDRDTVYYMKRMLFGKEAEDSDFINENGEKDSMQKIIQRKVKLDG